jgi:hypothetical protein
VAGVGAIYQAAALRVGLPFPDAILYTNHYVIYNAYEINGFVRVNSTFTEASAAAFYLTSGLAICLWRILSGAASLRYLCSSAIILAGLILTLSTTGYACLIVLIAVLAWRFFSYWRGAAYFRAFKLALLIPSYVLMASLALNAEFRSSFDLLMHTVLLDKADTASYRERTEVNNKALQVASDTDWLGAGWGVCRGSGFLPTLAANVGAPGALLLGGFAVVLFAPVWKRRRRLRPQHTTVLVALGVVIVDMVVSGPEINHPIIWLLSAMAARMASTGPVRRMTYPRESMVLKNCLSPV